MTDKEDRKKAFDPSKPIQTLDGRKAKIYETLPNGTIAAFIQKHLHSDEWKFKTYHKDGRTCSPHRLQELACGDDLVNIPPKKVKKEGWILIYPNKSKHWLDVIGHQTGIYGSEAAAWAKAASAVAARIQRPTDIVKIKWEEEE